MNLNPLDILAIMIVTFFALVILAIFLVAVYGDCHTTVDYLKATTAGLLIGALLLWSIDRVANLLLANALLSLL